MPTRTAPAKPAPARKTAAAKAPAAAPKAVAAVPAPKPAPKPVKEAKEPKAPKKIKLVRDGFTMPESDFALVAQLKQKAMSAGREAKKSELLRAGLHALATLDAAALAAALGALEPVKVGRPKKSH